MKASGTEFRCFRHAVKRARERDARRDHFEVSGEGKNMRIGQHMSFQFPVISREEGYYHKGDRRISRVEPA
jgi:hypothetical protein